MKERIQKVLAGVGVDSRRNVEKLVLEGRISVNGDTVWKLPVLVDVAKDKIEVDGEPVRFKGAKITKKVYVLMNKPKGVLCTNVAQGVQTRAIDLLPPDFAYRVYPVGRLDTDSRGLLLLTNDGELTNQLTHPRYGISKSYLAEVDGFVKGEVIEDINHKIRLADKQALALKTLSSHIKIINRGRDRSSLEITIREGRNLEIRRMLATLGHKVTKLTRIKMGNLTLKGVSPGKWRYLVAEEVKDLYAAVARIKKNMEKKSAPTEIFSPETDFTE